MLITASVVGVWATPVRVVCTIPGSLSLNANITLCGARDILFTNICMLTKVSSLWRFYDGRFEKDCAMSV